MIRECYPRVEAPSPWAILPIWEQYEKLTHARDDASLKKFLTSFEDSDLLPDHGCDSLESGKISEMLVDLRGKRALVTGSDSPSNLVTENDLLTIFQPEGRPDATYVVGHPRPDADSICSAIFEAIRRKVLHPDKSVHAWCEYVPHKVKYILGPQLSGLLSRIAKPQRCHNIVLVDCHETEAQFRMGVRSIIDHHIIRRSFPPYVSISHEVSWSSTIQVYIKILGSGLDLTPPLARLLLEATRLEAEPGLMEHISDLDRLAIRRLESTAANGADTYSHLMHVMTQASTPEELFYKDYKETNFGFAVIKSRRQQYDFSRLAASNNISRRIPLTIAKEVLYHKDFVAARAETILIVVNPNYHDKGFKAAFMDVIAKAWRQLHGPNAVRLVEEGVLVTGTNYQTPRLLLMPLVEDIVQEHLRFAYAPAINKFLSMGFYSGQSSAYGLLGDERHVCSGLSYLQVSRLLCGSARTSMLTLPEYWRVYQDFERLGLTYAVDSLRHPQYVELLDTVIPSSHRLIHGSTSSSKDIRQLEIQLAEPLASARPALIRAVDGDFHTGLPRKLHSADTYGDPSLWRYWSPDSDSMAAAAVQEGHNHASPIIHVATRGHIFVMNQTSLDLKVRIDEATHFLTFRPVYNDVPDIKYETVARGSWIELTVRPRLFPLLA